LRIKNAYASNQIHVDHVIPYTSSTHKPCPTIRFTEHSFIVHIV
jgi:hypothetical protein